MATWHQRKAGPILPAYENVWTVLVNGQYTARYMASFPNLGEAVEYANAVRAKDQALSAAVFPPANV